MKLLNSQIYQGAQSLLCVFDKDDLLATGRIGLWKAIKSFDNTKAKFASYAVKIIHNEMLMIFRSANCNCRIPMDKYISLETPVCEDDRQLRLSDTIVDNTNGAAYTELLSDIHLFTMNLSDKYKDVFNAMMNRENQIDIANRLGVSQSYIARIIKKLRLEFKEFYYGKIV